MSSVNIESNTEVIISDVGQNRAVKKSLFSKISDDGWALWIAGILIAVVVAVAFLNADFKKIF